MKKISKVKLFVNDNDISNEVSKTVEKALLNHNIEIVDDNFDLGIAIGGDGSFLRMIRECNFNTDILYVGVNAGTLGFAQDVSISEIDDFINKLSTNEFNYEDIGFQRIEITTKDEVFRINSLNEIVIRDRELNTIHFDIYVNDVLLENYVGDGILVSTSFGSTAYNLSFGGSIVYNTFDTLQITPIAPLNNKSYRCLSNSVIIPSNDRITIVPKGNINNILMTIDGKNISYNEVLKMETVINNSSIKIIRKNDYNFITKINDKFLK